MTSLIIVLKSGAVVPVPMVRMKAACIMMTFTQPGGQSGIQKFSDKQGITTAVIMNEVAAMYVSDRESALERVAQAIERESKEGDDWKGE